MLQCWLLDTVGRLFFEMFPKCAGFIIGSLSACLLCICGLVGGWEMQNDKLTIEILYESKCPDSKKFILEQLVPATELLKDYITLRFVPFGKATSHPDGFTCQHGPAECLGNLVQDCTLHVLWPDHDLGRLHYVACEMRTEAGSRGSLECAEEAGIAGSWVEECVTSPLGRELQLNSEQLTGLVRPQFIPTITVNGVFNQDIQDLAQIDLMETLCSLLQRAKPCAHFFNQMALNHLLTSPISFSEFLY